MHIIHRSKKQKEKDRQVRRLRSDHIKGIMTILYILSFLLLFVSSTVLCDDYWRNNKVLIRPCVCLNWLFFCVALRKLSKKSSNVEGKLERTSVIQQYSNFDSQVYAPMTRIGVYLDSGSEQYTVKNCFTTTLDGMKVYVASHVMIKGSKCNSVG